MARRTDRAGRWVFGLPALFALLLALGLAPERTADPVEHVPSSSHLPR